MVLKLCKCCSALCSSGLLGACLSDTELKTLATAQEKLLLVPDTAYTASVHTLTVEFAVDRRRKKHKLTDTRLWSKSSMLRLSRQHCCFPEGAQAAAFPSASHLVC